MAPKKAQKRDREEAVSPAAAPTTPLSTAAVPPAPVPDSGAAASQVAPTPAPPATETVVVAAKPPAKKNTARLTRSFRTAKEKMPLRPWHSSGPSLGGISASYVAELVAALSEEEKKRAAEGLDPLTSAEIQMMKRAEKYGALLQQTVVPTAAPAGKEGADSTVFAAREARFGSATVAADDSAAQKRLARFGGAEAAEHQDARKEALNAAMEARAKRFS
jgi:hypothetical protein